MKLNGCYDHAEFVAIQDAIKNNNLYGELKGATLYASTEPCAMCMGAILYEGIDKLFYGATLEDSARNNNDEVVVHCEDIAKATKNRKIEIHNIMRKEAAKVLKSRNMQN